MTTTTDNMYVGGMLDSAKIDRITIRGFITFDEDKGATLPLSSFDVTVTADVGPKGVLAPRLAPGKNPDIPRFASDPTSPVSVIDVTSDKATLVLPYALATMGFDTGIAISNMNTGDDQAGAISFMLYQNGDDPITLSTADMEVGRGLTNGVLEAGATYAVLLSQILDAAGVEAVKIGDYDDYGFSGYATITTDFTGADGIAYITDWKSFAATATLECTSGCE